MLGWKALGSKNEYKIGWITALAKEQAAAIALLDERHAQPSDFIPNENDDNVYKWGCVSGHNVVIVCLPAGAYGSNNATITTERLRSSLPHIKIGLLVGIGAGIPESGFDIRLGDVVVSQPEGTTGGVVQYDLGKEKQHGYERIGMLDKPPRVLLNALKNLQSEHELRDSEISFILQEAAQRHPKFALNYVHPGPEKDPFYHRTAGTANNKEAETKYTSRAGHNHVTQYSAILSGNKLVQSAAMLCQKPISTADIRKSEIRRTPRADNNPVIHYGTILSGNKLIRNAAARRQIFEAIGEVGVCLEMEAAGLMNNFPCLVIRGICDYADSDQNDDWQRYSSATAAAFAKELLLQMPKTEVNATKSITEVVDELNSHVRDLNVTLVQAEQKADEEKVSKFIQNLYSHAHAERKDRNPTRIDGTCKWFTEHPLFQDWSNGVGSQTLWVSADPGCGKSVLARYLVDDVLPQKNRTVCFFFFKDDFPDQKTRTAAARTILHQLLSVHRTVVSASMMNSIDAYGDKIVDSFGELWRVFLKATRNVNEEVVCVFDALDECKEEDRTDIIEAICGDVSSHGLPPRLKILALSRPYFGIRNDFERITSTIPILHLCGENDEEREQISTEIDLVIKHRINAFCKQRDLNQKDYDLLLEELMSTPQKTYLWAHLTMSFIENTPGFTRGHTKQLCKQLPPTVDAAYEKILERSVDESKTRMLLHIIVAAERPFTVREVSILLALDGTQKDYDQLREFIEPEHRFKYTLRDLCGLFVILVNNKVYLLHQTAREFLLQIAASDQRQGMGDFTIPNAYEPKTIAATWRQSISLPRSHHKLAELCIEFYILSNSQSRQFSNLYDYCVKNWPKHLRQSNIKPEDQLSETIYGHFLTASKRCESWFFRFFEPIEIDKSTEIHAYWEWQFLTHDMSTFSLKMACFVGVSSLVRSYFDGKWKQNWPKKTLSQALWHGLYSQSIGTVIALIRGGAELNRICSPSAIPGYNHVLQFPLYIAVRVGNIDIVRLLLHHGADINSLNSDGRTKDDTPLHVSSRSLNIATLLIDHGANSRIKNSEGDEPWMLLYKSHDYGHCSQAFRNLLRREEAGDPDRHGVNHRTALAYAAGSGCVACTEDLLKRGASVNFRDVSGRTPLHHAVNLHRQSRRNRSKLVKVLLDAGANADVIDT